MCRNIRPLNNFEPPATRDEVTAAALQYVRKVSGSVRPSQANQAAFDAAVAEVAHVTQHLLDALVTDGPAQGPRGGGDQGARPGAGEVRAVSRPDTSALTRPASEEAASTCCAAGRSWCSPAPG